MMLPEHIRGGNSPNPLPRKTSGGRFGRLPPFYYSFRDIRLWWGNGKIRPKIIAMLPGCTVHTRVCVIFLSFSSLEDTDLLFFIKRGSIYPLAHTQRDNFTFFILNIIWVLWLRVSTTFPKCCESFLETRFPYSHNVATFGPKQNMNPSWKVVYIVYTGWF